MSINYIFIDYHNLIHYYLTKLDLLDFHATSMYEVQFIYDCLKECYESIINYLDF